MLNAKEQNMSGAMIDRQELINEFEAAWEDEEKVSALKSQAKVISDSIKERIGDYAESIEVNKKLVAEAYSRFKKLKQKKMKASDEDYYALIEAVDEHFIEEEEQEKDDKKA